jgi:hypothetical protein
MNALLAQLDRRLARRGEQIYLRRTVGSSNQSFVQCRIPALVRALTVEQLIGNITQQNYFIICSPTHINEQQWPGGKTPAATGGIIAPTDPRLPITTDTVFLRGASKAMVRVAPVFDRGECIRIEFYVLG